MLTIRGQDAAKRGWRNMVGVKIPSVCVFCLGSDTLAFVN